MAGSGENGVSKRGYDPLPPFGRLSPLKGEVGRSFLRNYFPVSPRIPEKLPAELLSETLLHYRESFQNSPFKGERRPKGGRGHTPAC